jgi:prolyl-tRNA editing enzyme YbaK/EbsC (Cys-tRNA(Pro) deacylase)
MSAVLPVSVQRVQDELMLRGSDARVIALEATARTADDAARACGVPAGAIVKTLLFMIGDQPVLALIAGDRRCEPSRLPAALGISGAPRRASADEVRTATGYAIGGVAPLAHPDRLPVVIDVSLGRFERLFAAAGHPFYVFETDLGELRRLTEGVSAGDISV